MEDNPPREGDDTRGGNTTDVTMVGIHPTTEKSSNVANSSGQSKLRGFTKVLTRGNVWLIMEEENNVYFDRRDSGGHMYHTYILAN